MVFHKNLSQLDKYPSSPLQYIYCFDTISFLFRLLLERERERERECVCVCVDEQKPKLTNSIRRRGDERDVDAKSGLKGEKTLLRKNNNLFWTNWWKRQETRITSELRWNEIKFPKKMEKQTKKPNFICLTVKNQLE